MAVVRLSSAKEKKMVYDCFMLLDEIDLLEIRLNVLNSIVDYFVITEATTTQMGEKRELIFPKVQDRFVAFKHKIIYNVCDNDAMQFENQWERETYQKNYVINGLKEAVDEDIMMYSDVDEIPNPDKIQEILSGFEQEKIYHFVQRMFNFYLNYENVDNYLLAFCGDFPGVYPERWLGTKLCTIRIAREKTVDGLRAPQRIKEPGVRVEEGGWHFSYMGGSGAAVTKRVKHKLKSFSHAEFNNWRYYNIFHIKKTIRQGKDFLGRTAIFRKVKIDDSYPSWIVEHHKDYPHLVL